MKPRQPFHILISNFGKNIRFNITSICSIYDMIPGKIVESDITHAELLGLSREDVDTKFRKPQVQSPNIATINKHLTELQEENMGEDEMTVTAARIYLDVRHEKITKTATCSGSISKCGLVSKERYKKPKCGSTLSRMQNYCSLLHIESALKRQNLNGQTSIKSWRLELLKKQ